MACDSDKPKPDGITGLVNGHSLSTDDRSCLMCGETAKNMSLMVVCVCVWVCDVGVGVGAGACVYVCV